MTLRSAAPAFFSVFRNRAFALIWAGQLISAMGNALTALAASILAFRVTGSAWSVGLMLIATSGPTLVVGLLAGVFVDRYDRKRILLLSTGLRAVLVLLMPLLLPFGIHWLYVLVALTSAVSQFFDSAQASILPEIATDRELSAANAMMTISSIGSMTVGYAAAGLISASFKIDWVFYLNAAALLLSGWLTWLTHIPSLPEMENTSLRAIGRNLQAGWQTVQATPSLRSLFIILVPIFLLFGLQTSLILPFSIRELQATDFHFGLQQAAETVGITLGSLLMVRLADRLRDGQWLAISFLGIALAMILYALAGSVWLAILMMGLSGFLNAPSYVGRQLVIQRATPRELRGRVNSAYFVLRDLASVLGLSLAGLADVLEVRSVFLLSAVLLLAVSAVILVMPGLGQPAAEWRRAVALLRGAEAAPRLGGGRLASRLDVERLIQHLPELSVLGPAERQQLAANTLVAEAGAGRVITYVGEASDMAYFILKGSVVVGYLREAEYVLLKTLQAGDFFGEVAALTGYRRTANIITEEPCEFLIVPARVLQKLEQDHAVLSRLLRETVVQRLAMIDLPVGMSQDLLRDLRTPRSGLETEPAVA